MQYFISKDFCFPENAKTSSNAVCHAILQKDFPEKFAEINEADAAENPFIYRTHVEQTDTPQLPILMLMREPVDRFISAASMNHGLWDVQEIIDSLTSGTGYWAEGHLFQKQSDFVIEGKTTIFKFPDQLKEFCAKAGFQFPLPKLNEATGEKKTLTPEQLAFVQEYYADDINLFGSL